MSEREFLISGLKDGDRRAEYVTAKTAQEAVFKGEDMGLTDVQLLTTDSSSRLPIDRAIRAANREAMPAWFAARLIQAGPVEAYILNVLNIYRILWYFPALALAVVIIHLALGYPPNWIEAVAVLVAAFPFAFFALTGAYAGLFQQDPGAIDRAFLAADWDKVIELTHISDPAAVDPALLIGRTRWRAKAYAAKGDIQQATQLIDSLKSIDGLGDPLRLTMLGGVYETAREFDNAVRAYEDALHADPDFAEAWLALALVLAVHMRSADDARDALAHAESLPIAEPVRAMVQLCQASIAIEEGDPKTALHHLAVARDLLERNLQSNPLLALSIAGADASCALAHASLGDVRQAEQHLDRARPLLSLHIPEAIRRCEEEIAAIG